MNYSDRWYTAKERAIKLEQDDSRSTPPNEVYDAVDELLSAAICFLPQSSQSYQNIKRWAARIWSMYGPIEVNEHRRLQRLKHGSGGDN